MFGLICAGRPVEATPQAVTDVQYAFKIPSTPAFNHIVVFMLPGTQLPEGTAACVFIQIPPSQDFKLLGGIGPGKESAIFRVSGLKTAGSGPNDLDADLMTDDDAQANVNHATGGDIVIGISIEPAAQVEAQLATLKQAQIIIRANGLPSTALVQQASETGGRTTTKVMAQRIIGNAFNFLASFGSDTVPLKAFQDWWTKFEKRVDLDPSFLERQEQG